MKQFKKFVALLLAVVLVMALTGCDSMDYKKAQDLYDDGEFEDAKEIFEELDDYEDSEDMVIACDYGIACQLLEDGKYEEAREAFQDLGDYEDSEEQYRAAGWYMLYDSLGPIDEAVTFTHTVDSGATVVGMLYAEDGYIYVGVQNKYDAGGGDYVKTLMLGKHGEGESKANFYMSYEMVVLGYTLQEETQFDLPIASYQKGDSVNFGSVDKTYTNSAFADSNEILENGAGYVSIYVASISVLLEETGLDVTVADLGYLAYE